MSANPVPHLTPEQYLEIERKAEFKSEYFEGQMYAMAGTSYAHALIAANMLIALGGRLRGRNCNAVSSDLRLRVSPSGLFTYPDISVFCGKPELADAEVDTLLNPIVVVEVLSKSTEAYDRGLKFAQYRKIESLHEYVLASQYEPRVETFRRMADGAWSFREFAGLEAELPLESIGCSIPLREIYDQVEFVSQTRP